MVSVLSLWERFLGRLEAELSKETVDRWARNLVVKQAGERLIIEAKDSFQALWFEEHLRPRLSCFVDPMGTPIQVVLQVAGRSSPKKKSRWGGRKAKPPFFSLTFPDLDPTCTFEHFLVREENEIVIKVLDDLCTYLSSERLKKLSSLVGPNHEKGQLPPPNPIYLCGPAGSGKTHLLTATAHRLKQAGLSVTMARSDLFTEHVVRSIRAGEMASFRQLWRTADVLLVDDVHHLARKSATQEEFFHTFNSLHVPGKQIILSANCFPQQLQFIEPRLISRFEWGVVLPLQSLPKKRFPALLEKKASFLNFSLPPKMAHALADLFQSTLKSSVRALEALVFRLNLSKNRSGTGALSFSQMKDLLADLIEEEHLLAITPEKIINVTSEAYGMKREDLLGRAQSREFVLPRQVSMYLIRKYLKTPYMKIGDLFHKNHSTVMSAIRQVEKSIPDANSDVGSSIAAIEMRLSELGK